MPNLGGFVGVSFRLADAKVSFGYRGDFFIGAIDGGLDVQKSYNRSFYGPFANFSIGMGDYVLIGFCVAPICAMSMNRSLVLADACLWNFAMDEIHYDNS